MPTGRPWNGLRKLAQRCKQTRANLKYSCHSTVPKWDVLVATRQLRWDGCGWKQHRCLWGTVLNYLADRFMHYNQKQWLRATVS